MSQRRDAVERAADREQAALDKALDRGDISPEQYREDCRELEREAQAQAREAYERDLEDVHNDWGW